MADAYVQMLQSEWLGMQNNFSMYQISAVLLLFAIIGLVVLFLPTLPFVIARFITHETVVGVLDKNRNITPRLGFKLVNNIWYYKGTPLWFIKKYPGRFFFAGLPFEVIAFDMAMIKNPAYLKYTEELRNVGYANMDALENAISFSMMTEYDPRVDEIIRRGNYKGYEDARLSINPANLTIDSAIVKPFFTSISLQELMGYGADIPAENILGEVDDIFESKKPSLQAMKKIQNILPWCILLLAGAAAAVIAYKLLK